jgi:primosomal protein N' (replication factor Y)
MTLYAEVALPLPLYSTFTYRVPPEWQATIKPGVAVIVPFRERRLMGVVVDLKTELAKKSIRLKSIQEVVHPEFFLAERYLSFTRRLANYYLLPWGEILAAAFPRVIARVQQRRVRLTADGRKLWREKKGPLEVKERRVINFIGDKDYTLTYLKRKIKDIDISAVISRLEKKKLVDVSTQKVKIPSYSPTASLPKEGQLEIPFGSDQETVSLVTNILARIKKSKFSQFYVHGSDEWRREIYFLLINQLASGEGQCLLLVPEILPGSPLVERLVSRLGEKVIFYHSQLTPRALWSSWRDAVEGKVKVIVGTRSALFLPLPFLKLIIVDGEADTSYYQMETPRYDAREGAFWRAKEEDLCLIFGGATPRVESYYKCVAQGWIIQERDSEQPGKVIINDFISSERLFSSRLSKRLKQAFKEGQQFILFFNRLGQSAMFFCPECGGRLTRSSRGEKVICPSGHSFPSSPLKCSHCGTPGVEYKGWGIEQVAWELREMLPEIKIGLISSATTRTKAKLAAVLSGFKKQRFQALIGTEMMLHQPLPASLELAVALRPEIALGLPDFDAGQKMYQSLIRLRKYLRPDQKSELWIQTGLPDHHAFQALLKGNYRYFYEKEVAFREAMNLPPFTRVVQVFFSGKALPQLGKETRAFISYLRKLKEVEWIGPRITYHPQNQRVRGIQILLKLLAPEKESLISQLRVYFMKRKISPWIKIQG